MHVSADWITALSTLCTVVVIGATAFAALVQLRHLRAANQLDALLSLERDFRATELQEALRYVQEELPKNLEDPVYRDELARLGYIDPQKHPELTLCNWFNAMGALLKYQLVSESTFMDLFGRLIAYYWKVLAPAVAVMRRNRGDSQYHDFEYLAIRANEWLRAHPHGHFPAGSQRLAPQDPWLQADTRSSLS